MEKRLVVTLYVDELKELIEECVSKALSKDPKIEKEDKPLHIKQAAEYLGLTVPTIYGLIHRKTIPVSKIGRHLYFSKKELNAWLQTGRKLTISEISLAARIKMGDIGIK